jgi:hypothetical protein
MSTHTGGFRPGLLTALVKVAMIGTWRGRTFLDDNLELDDIAGFVPDEPVEVVQLGVGPTLAEGPGAAQPMATPRHSVAA